MWVRRKGARPRRSKDPPCPLTESWMRGRPTSGIGESRERVISSFRRRGSTGVLDAAAPVRGFGCRTLFAARVISLSMEERTKGMEDIKGMEGNARWHKVVQKTARPTASGWHVQSSQASACRRRSSSCPLQFATVDRRPNMRRSRHRSSVHCPRRRRLLLVAEPATASSAYRCWPCLWRLWRRWRRRRRCRGREKRSDSRRGMKGDRREGGGKRPGWREERPAPGRGAGPTFLAGESLTGREIWLGLTWIDLD